MRTPLFIIAALSTFVFACNNNKPDQQYVPLSNVLAKSATPGATPATGETAATAATGAVKLNPKHGEPGHRCDIPDGAPLPTQQAAGSASIFPTTPTATTPAKTPAATTVFPASAAPAPSSSPAGSAGLNPEHGKPGHRCEIAVGAPLNSKPTTSATPSVSTTPVTTAAKVAPGMNPAHGEPGHKCEIAVGAPLNEKKVEPVQVKSGDKDSSQ